MINFEDPVHAIFFSDEHAAQQVNEMEKFDGQISAK